METNNKPTILAIDTSCDETSVAVVRGVEVLSNCLYSQLELHKEYGGVVPSIAKLAHQEKIDGILKQALGEAEVALEDLDAIAVTQGPGLAIALEIGILKAKELSTQLNIPIYAINHMEGHLLSALAVMEPGAELDFKTPALGVLVSGGHTEFILVNEIGEYLKIGSTLDDACGEAFDKSAKMLGLDYPGGPVISKLANEYRGSLEIRMEREHRTLLVRGYGEDKVVPKYELPIPMAYSEDLNVSYSGLKTAVKQLINQLSEADSTLNIAETGKKVELTEQQRGEVSLMFETAALRTLTLKLEWALKQHEVKEIWTGGGVLANDRFRTMIQEVADEYQVQVRFPSSKKLMTDNAAMIGVAAGYRMAAGFAPTEGKIDRDPGMSL